MSIYNVQLKKVVDDSYDIEIGFGLTDKLIEDIKGGLVGNIKKFAIITDSIVKDLYALKIYKMLLDSGYTSDILTISLDNIINELTLDERSVVKSILDKLSVIDCAKVNSILNSGSIDSKEEALSYIKKRLIEEDYNRLEGILNQYIELV